ncbi:cytochrome b5-like [Papaver somniferum]|uniref:cytochrome b5-like n=1 Tax=Papaver somniferum TaxID=3469 RepID=UPI000E701685|nr:cytochrome b5-like [Papaver somniferum]XP_026426685.1 cytochrome b5-like [Papaver somniferum]
MKTHSYEDLLKHNQNKDCWLLISGKVYDVTEFMEDHPGGDQVLLTAAGKDATEDFEDVGHSESARDMLVKYCIGDIDSSTIPVKRQYTPAGQQIKTTLDTTSGFGVKILQFLVPLLILGLAFGIRQYSKKLD